MRNISFHYPAPIDWKSGDREKRYFALFWASAFLSFVIFATFAVFEWRVIGMVRLGIDTLPLFTPYYLCRTLVAFALAFLIVGQLYIDRAPYGSFDRQSLLTAQRAIVIGVLTLAAGFVVLFVSDATAFNRLSLEDNAIEWVSALLPLAASGLLLYAFVRVRRARARDLRWRLALFGTAGSAFVLFLLCMEEISWMQRVFQIETPELFAGNQQQEMNLHNMSTYAVGTIHRLVGFACLILLPFMYETAPRNRWFELVSDFIPSRFVVAVSSPLAAFNYNDWNVFPTQMAGFMTLLILLFYARSAQHRGDGKEMALFVAAAVFLVVAQIAFLARGETFVRVWDVSEYKELFIVIGLSLFAWEATQRLLARYGTQTRALAHNPLSRAGER